ncbi:hypothetical protein [Demequina rhizosphaerae]|uniref:hypothetical protein n=1 Tax=Demequina rhizosphaerae TaxID=1638985 RepID=UPI00078431BD|nr:hypothetical protein [Demequina rhizosphaerae]
MTTDPFVAPPTPPRSAPVESSAPVAAPAPLRDIPGWGVALIVLGGLVLHGGIGVGSYLASAPAMAEIEDAVAAASPAATPERIMHWLPPEWTRLESASGRIVYYVDASWEEYEGFSNVDEGTVLTGSLESIAAFAADGDTDYARTWVGIYAAHDSPLELGVKDEAHGFLDTWATEYDALEITAERALITGLKYDAYEIEADATYDGWPTHECLMAIAADDSLVVIYASADPDSLECTDVTRTMAQGIIAE